jgi:hypothetical protein
MFGPNAYALLMRTLNLFDRNTMVAAGLPRAGTQRLIAHKKLQDWTKGTIGRLFDDQMSILKKGMLQRFQAALLQKMDGNNGMLLLMVGDNSKFLKSNAKALRCAAFAVSALLLEVLFLSLTKLRAMCKMDNKLNSVLIPFLDLPAARIRSCAKVDCILSKKKQPTEGSVSVALDLFAMVHPDWFGKLQGFAGYQLGPQSMTVGVHNDTDVRSSSRNSGR